jgi:hypothetical protein
MLFKHKNHTMQAADLGNPMLIALSCNLQQAKKQFIHYMQLKKSQKNIIQAADSCTHYDICSKLQLAAS